MRRKINRYFLLVLLLGFINTALPYHVFKLKDFSCEIENNKETSEDGCENEEDEFIKENLDIKLSADVLILQHINLMPFSIEYYFSFKQDIIPPPPKQLT